MFAYVLYFAIIMLLGISYVYNHFILAPKQKALHNANDFRYARNLNTELINQLNYYSAYLQDYLFDGDTYETTIANLLVLHNNVYTTDTFKQLTGKQKVKRRHVDALLASINQQVQMQQQLKVSLNSVTRPYKKLIAA